MMFVWKIHDTMTQEILINSLCFVGKKRLYSFFFYSQALYRLDRLTSGILVLPKTLKMSQKWEKQLANKEFYKEYVCRVEGEFPE